MPKARTPKLQICLYALMSLAWITLHSFVIPLVTCSWPKWLVSYSYWAAIIFAAITSITDPGWLGKNKAKPVYTKELTHAEKEKRSM